MMATGRQPAREFGERFSAHADLPPLPRQRDPQQTIADLQAERGRLRDLLFRYYTAHRKGASWGAFAGLDSEVEAALGLDGEAS